MNNDITELRSHLFDTLRGLKDGSIKIETAKAINDTAQTIINSAKAETDMLALVGGQGTGFVPRQISSGTPPKLPGLADQVGAAGSKRAA